jgi:hypothetical protein
MGQRMKCARCGVVVVLPVSREAFRRVDPAGLIFRTSTVQHHALARRRLRIRPALTLRFPRFAGDFVIWMGPA